MIVLDANLWIAAFEPDDAFHRDSVAVLRAAAADDLSLVGPAFVILETTCALARRTGKTKLAAFAHAEMTDHPALRLEPLDAELLARAEDLGVGLRLRASDALYAATAERLAAPLLSWDRELVERARAISPDTWLLSRTGRGDIVSEPTTPRSETGRSPKRRRPGDGRSTRSRPS